MPESRICRCCGRAVVAAAADYEVFEQMHYVCFHFEFEHAGDPDVECLAGGCPASGIGLPSRLLRTEGVDLVQAANTVVPALLALRQLGYELEQHEGRFIAKTAHARFSADDPVAVLGLVRLAELRRPWRATDAEVEGALTEFDL